MCFLSGNGRVIKQSYSTLGKCSHALLTKCSKSGKAVSDRQHLTFPMSVAVTSSGHHNYKRSEDAASWSESNSWLKEMSIKKNLITTMNNPCVYCLNYYISFTFSYYLFGSDHVRSSVWDRLQRNFSTVDSVSSFNEWNCLNVPPDDTVRMCNWHYEPEFLAEDIGPTRSGHVHYVTSQIKPAWRTGHIFVYTNLF